MRLSTLRKGRGIGPEFAAPKGTIVRTVGCAKGKVILLNGASSSGKTTLALALQDLLPEPFLHFSFDHLREGGILPMDRIKSGEFDWSGMRLAVFNAYHRCLAAMADAGCNVLADHIIETEAWRSELAALLVGTDLFVVEVFCPLEVLEARERDRGDRRIGEARRDFETCYDICDADLRVDSSAPAVVNAKLILEAWKTRDPIEAKHLRKKS